MTWGKLTIINLYECNSDYIKNKAKIKQFLNQLCKKINMKPFGKPLIKKFGKNKLKGYSAIQLLETSSITIHFDETKNRAFIDIFSCKALNAKKTESFSKKFFKAKSSKSQKISRQ